MPRAFVLALALTACASTPTSTPPRTSSFAWRAWDTTTFAAARAEARPLLVHMAASWCHWCHVMEDTTYTDPDVARLIAERFVPIRVDSDARPDLAERFADYAWPGTILLTPDATTIVAAYKGYIPAARMIALLDAALSAKPTTAVVEPEPSAPVDALPWVLRSADLILARRWDPKYAGWGSPKRAANGAALAWECRRAAHDPAARTRAERVIAAQDAILDHTWGGFYQYSETPDWQRPHIEKLVDQQGWMLEGLAACIDAGVAVEAARAQVTLILRWLDHNMTTADGLLMTAQDAELQTATHTPWIDTHVYARENGLVLSGLVALASDRAMRTRAALLVAAIRTRWPELPRRDGQAYLEDAAALGEGLARWAALAHDDAAHAAAVHLWDDAKAAFGSTGAAFYETTLDPNAVGLFAERRLPFDGNVRMARFALALALDRKDDARAILVAVATPSAIEDQGAWLGDFLLAGGVL